MIDVSSAPLSGRAVLVVEDEYIIADDTAHLLEEAGASVLGPTPSVAGGLALLDESDIDLAILDVNLGGEPVWPLADALEKRGIRFVFATGYDRSVLPHRYDHVPRCEKPVSMRALATLLSS